VAVTQATVEGIQAQAGVVADDVQRYLARTMTGSFGEAFFARAVLVVEGPTDAATFAEAAELLGTPLAPAGVTIAIVSKPGMPTAISVLEQLGIPAFVVFDGDASTTGERHDAAQSVNQKLLAALGGGGDPFPSTGSQERWVVFRDDLEEYLRSEISDFDETVSTVGRELSWKPKSPEVYGEALHRLGVDSVPELVRYGVERVLAMVQE
jgi:hypothetical protein